MSPIRRCPERGAGVALICFDYIGGRSAGDSTWYQVQFLTMGWLSLKAGASSIAVRGFRLCPAGATSSSPGLPLRLGRIL
jgi:hypothetical protein